MRNSVKRHMQPRACRRQHNLTADTLGGDNLPLNEKLLLYAGGPVNWPIGSAERFRGVY